MNNFLVCNFYDIARLKLFWSEGGFPLSIEFTDDDLYSPHCLPRNIEKIFYVIENYYEIERYDILELLQGVPFSNFEKKVYIELTKVPPGEVISYLELSKMIGYKNGSRAVGNAMRRNRFPILIPCHRVVSKNGLGGFTPGLSLKKRLLNFEKGIKK